MTTLGQENQSNRGAFITKQEEEFISSHLPSPPVQLSNVIVSVTWRLSSTELKLQRQMNKIKFLKGILHLRYVSIKKS